MRSIPERGIWTWGHVIYDYRGFFRNMNALGMNKITVWNDFAPVNAKEIMAEAHKYGISVVWGFSWGWNNIPAEDIGSGSLNRIKENALKTFFEQYRGIASDGIYFQSFTELADREINGVCIARAVTELVNSVCAELYKTEPELNIEFGLHAQSVRNDLDMISETDRRVKIIWEDLGAFPFSYSADDIKDFEAAYELAERVMRLRGGDEKCGFVTKGMTQLDWSAFRHAREPAVIGESGRDFILERQAEKNAVWERQTNGWRENRRYAEKMFGLFRNSENVVSVQSLIEDGMFENEIKEPAVVFSELCGK